VFIHEEGVYEKVGTTAVYNDTIDEKYKLNGASNVHEAGCSHERMNESLKIFRY
jgi:hypothetical protein